MQTKAYNFEGTLSAKVYFSIKVLLVIVFLVLLVHISTRCLSGALFSNQTKWVNCCSNFYQDNWKIDWLINCENKIKIYYSVCFSISNNKHTYQEVMIRNLVSLLKKYIVMVIADNTTWYEQALCYHSNSLSKIIKIKH